MEGTISYPSHQLLWGMKRNFHTPSNLVSHLTFLNGAGLGDVTRMKSTHQLCPKFSTEKRRDLMPTGSRSKGRKDDNAKAIRGILLAGLGPW